MCLLIIVNNCLTQQHRTVLIICLLSSRQSSQLRRCLLTGGEGLLRCNPHFVDVVEGQAGRQATPLLESSSAVILASSYILLQKKNFYRFIGRDSAIGPGECVCVFVRQLWN